jgi:Heterokaryon incompatibility protein (HET)
LATMPPHIEVGNAGMLQPAVLYVAISHVWSEGMGNPRRNSLPKCQLYELQTRVNALYDLGEDGAYGGVPFWIDTLCVPLEQNARKQAVSLMRKTFENADAVLVFDSSLLPYSVHTSSEELMMRINYCRWVTRLWTFQEGVLARRLFFQFSDGATSIGELMERYFADQRTKDVHRFPTLQKDSQFFRLLAEEASLDAKSARTRSFKTARLDSIFATALGFLKFVDGTFLKRGELHERIAALTKPLSDRATSRAEDEAICLAGLLNLGDNVVVKLLDTPAEERMIRLMSSIDVFPSDFIFGDSPRIFGVPGCGWMPTSLLNAGENATLAISDKKALRCSAGLVVTLPGLRLQDPNDPRLTTVTHHGNRTRILIAIEERVYQALLTPTAGKWRGCRISQLGLILRHPTVGHIPVQAVLVADCHDGVANVILCKYYAFGEIWLVPQVELDEHRLGTKNCIPSRSQPSMQQWCIG